MTTDAPRPIDDGETFAAAGGALAVLALAMALVPVRTTLGPANVALLLTVVVMGACAAGGRRAGGVTALVAALAFNFFHTRPYLSLDVHHARDIVTLALMVVVGLAAGGIARQRHRATEEARALRRALERLADVAALGARDAAPEAVVERVERVLTVALDALAVRIEIPTGTDDLPVVHRHGDVDPVPGGRVHPTVELVDGPVAVPIAFGLRPLGRIVVDPGPGRHLDPDGATTAAVAADQVALALAHGLPPVPRTGEPR